MHMQNPNVFEQRANKNIAHPKRTKSQNRKPQPTKRFSSPKRQLAAAERHLQAAIGLYLAIHTFQVIGLKGLQVSLLVKQVSWAAYSDGGHPPRGHAPSETPPRVCLGVAEFKQVM